MTNGTSNIQQKIKEHLIETKRELNDYLAGTKKKFLFELALQTNERQEKAQKILAWIDKILSKEEKKLEDYKTLYNNWNEGQKDYDGKLDLRGTLLTLKNLLDEWENPPKPPLTEEEQKKLSNYDNIHEQLLTNFRQQLNERILDFQTSMDVTREDLRNKYGSKDYRKIIRQDLTLDDLTSKTPEDTLRVVINICATEKAIERDKNLKKEIGLVISMLNYLKLIRNNWRRTLTDIPSEKNELYLPIIGNQQTYRQKIEDLITKWEKEIS